MYYLVCNNKLCSQTICFQFFTFNGHFNTLVVVTTDYWRLAMICEEKMSLFKIIVMFFICRMFYCYHGYLWLFQCLLSRLNKTDENYVTGFICVCLISAIKLHYIYAGVGQNSMPCSLAEQKMLMSTFYLVQGLRFWGLCGCLVKMRFVSSKSCSHSNQQLLE